MNRNANQTHSNSDHDSNAQGGQREWELSERELEEVFQQLPGLLGPC